MKIVLLAALALRALIYDPVRPPEPPVPFPYDPNSVKSEIIEAVQISPSVHIYKFDRKVIEPDGQAVTLTCSDPSVVIGEPVIIIDPDPNNVQPDPNDPNNMIPGPGLIYTFPCTMYLYRPPGVYSPNFKAADNDPNDPRDDERTALIKRNNRAPIISQ